MGGFLWKLVEFLFFGLFPGINATEEELLMWRRLVGAAIIVLGISSFINSAYSFGYLGFAGFASQQSVQQLIINDLREQISRVTIRWCVARMTNNDDAFKLATNELIRLKDQYMEITGGQIFSPTCMELLING